MTQVGSVCSCVGTCFPPHTGHGADSKLSAACRLMQPGRNLTPERRERTPPRCALDGCITPFTVGAALLHYGTLWTWSPAARTLRGPQATRTPQALPACGTMVRFPSGHSSNSAAVLYPANDAYTKFQLFAGSSCYALCYYTLHQGSPTRLRAPISTHTTALDITTFRITVCCGSLLYATYILHIVGSYCSPHTFSYSLPFPYPFGLVPDVTPPLPHPPPLLGLDMLRICSRLYMFIAAPTMTSYFRRCGQCIICMLPYYLPLCHALVPQHIDVPGRHLLRPFPTLRGYTRAPAFPRHWFGSSSDIVLDLPCDGLRWLPHTPGRPHIYYIWFFAMHDVTLPGYRFPDGSPPRPAAGCTTPPSLRAHHHTFPTNHRPLAVPVCWLIRGRILCGTFPSAPYGSGRLWLDALPTTLPAWDI